jgi:hypothetical protein
LGYDGVSVAGALNGLSLRPNGLSVPLLAGAA